MLPRHALRCGGARWCSAAAAAAVTAAYRGRVAAGRVREDAVQVALAERLDGLHAALVRWEAQAQAAAAAAAEAAEAAEKQEALKAEEDKEDSPAAAPSPPPQPKGLYIHGSVGVGKTMVMDMFYRACGGAVARSRKRVHFHEFMLDVHRRIHAARQAKKGDGRDAVATVAVELAAEAQLLCFDEFQVTDIADALIVRRLFSLLFDRGVVLVATSNRAPQMLYDGGFNRQHFLGFIDVLQSNCEVVHVDSDHDYRKDHVEVDFKPRYYYHPVDTHAATMGLQQIFFEASTHMKVRESAADADVKPDANGKLKLPLRQHNRFVTVNRARGAAAWFQFEELCGAALSAADYLCLAERFRVVIVEGIPQLGAENNDHARRFVTLIDALYEKGSKLVLSADVPLDELFQAFETEVVFRGSDEETFPYSPPPVNDGSGEGEGGRAAGAPAVEDHTEMWVSTSGGASSSNSTTMLQTKHGAMEWSATGRVGVSLAQLSAVKDVAFSFRRAQSRLVEMNRPGWGEDED